MITRSQELSLFLVKYIIYIYNQNHTEIYVFCKCNVQETLTIRIIIGTETIFTKMNFKYLEEGRLGYTRLRQIRWSELLTHCNLLNT